MSFNVDLDKVDLNVSPDLVVQRYGWNFNSLDAYSLEPVSETRLSSDEATAVLWYQQVRASRSVRDGDRSKVDVWPRLCKFLQNPFIGGVGLVAIHETSYPNSARQVITEQSPTGPHVDYSRPVSDQLIGHHRRKVSHSSLPRPEDLDCSFHSGLAQVPPDASWRQIVSNPVRAIALEQAILHRHIRPRAFIVGGPHDHVACSHPQIAWFSPHHAHAGQNRVIPERAGSFDSPRQSKYCKSAKHKQDGKGFTESGWPIHTSLSDVGGVAD